jgi:hypothetical protein
VRLKFQPSGLELDGTLANGQLNGTVRTVTYGERPFTAAAYCTCLLAGRFDGVSFNLRYFDGVRAALLEIEPAKDGGLELLWKSPEDGSKKLKAVRVKGD